MSGSLRAGQMNCSAGRQRHLIILDQVPAGDRRNKSDKRQAVEGFVRHYADLFTFRRCQLNRPDQQVVKFLTLRQSLSPLAQDRSSEVRDLRGEIALTDPNVLYGEFRVRDQTNEELVIQHGVFDELRLSRQLALNLMQRAELR